MLDWLLKFILQFIFVCSFRVKSHNLLNSQQVRRNHVKIDLRTVFLWSHPWILIIRSDRFLEQIRSRNILRLFIFFRVEVNDVKTFHHQTDVFSHKMSQLHCIQNFLINHLSVIVGSVVLFDHLHQSLLLFDFNGKIVFESELINHLLVGWAFSKQPKSIDLFGRGSFQKPLNDNFLLERNFICNVVHSILLNQETLDMLPEWKPLDRLVAEFVAIKVDFCLWKKLGLKNLRLDLEPHCLWILEFGIVGFWVDLIFGVLIWSEQNLYNCLELDICLKLTNEILLGPAINKKIDVRTVLICMWLDKAFSHHHMIQLNISDKYLSIQPRITKQSRSATTLIRFSHWVLCQQLKVRVEFHALFLDKTHFSQKRLL